jgi:hypothetical protein
MIRSFALVPWATVPIMIPASCLGGVANYFSLALGIVASLMVPLRLYCGRKGCQNGNPCFIRGGDRD